MKKRIPHTKKKLPVILAAFLMIAGAVFLLYHPITGWLGQREAAKETERFYQIRGQLQEEKADEFDQMQIFIEPKGSQLLAVDAWKEKFLMEMEENAVLVKILADNNHIKIWGMPFFNEDSRKKYDDSFQKLLRRKE